MTAPVVGSRGLGFIVASSKLHECREPWRQKAGHDSHVGEPPNDQAQPRRVSGVGWSDWLEIAFRMTTFFWFYPQYAALDVLKFVW